MPNDYPLPAFYFKVIGTGFETSFQEVSGISQELETEDVIEGGENDFVHRLPKAMKHPKLVLKRGVAPITSLLITWVRASLEGGLRVPIVPLPVLLVTLMNAESLPVRGWSFTNVYPTKWSIDTLNSTKNEVAIETIELSYNGLHRIV